MLNFLVFFFHQKNLFNIYTSYIKHHFMVFSEQFKFWVSHIPKKSNADLKSRGKKFSPNWKMLGSKPLCGPQWTFLALFVI